MNVVSVTGLNTSHQLTDWTLWKYHQLLLLLLPLLAFSTVQNHAHCGCVCEFICCFFCLFVTLQWIAVFSKVSPYLCHTTAGRGYSTSPWPWNWEEVAMENKWMRKRLSRSLTAWWIPDWKFNVLGTIQTNVMVQTLGKSFVDSSLSLIFL